MPSRERVVIVAGYLLFVIGCLLKEKRKNNEHFHHYELLIILRGYCEKLPKADQSAVGTINRSLHVVDHSSSRYSAYIVNSHYDSNTRNTVQLVQAMADKLGEHGAEYV